MPVVVTIPKESKGGELRVALTPGLVGRLAKLGVEVRLQAGAGGGIYQADSSYPGVKIVRGGERLYGDSGIILKVQPPTLEEIAQMPVHSILISFLYPHLQPEIVPSLLERKITSLAMELIPRISRAQDMDALSSQATVVGYKAVLIAADRSRFFFPMLTTAAGSIRPAKVLVIGAGVAGLQAIATARRLGAQVSAYDVRPDTREQVESLGAKFVDTGIQALGAGGYARELTEEERLQQSLALQNWLAGCDVVITTAGVPGRPAPQIITRQMVEAMKPGSLIVDTLAESGGNCELTKLGKTVIYHDVTILGPLDLASGLAIHASEMYARNLINLLGLLVKDGELVADWEDEVLAAAMVTRNGEICHPQVVKQLAEVTI